MPSQEAQKPVGHRAFNREFPADIHSRRLHPTPTNHGRPGREFFGVQSDVSDRAGLSSYWIAPKMAFRSIQEITNASCRRGVATRVGSDEVAFATDLASRKAGGACYSMRIGIPTHVAKKARLIGGDRVDILFDEGAGMGLVRRVNGNGWKLTPTHRGGRLTVKVTLRPGMPTVAESSGCRCEITDEGIVFALPQDASFSENLREKRDVR